MVYECVSLFQSGESERETLSERESGSACESEKGCGSGSAVGYGCEWQSRECECGSFGCQSGTESGCGWRTLYVRSQSKRTREWGTR